MAIEDSGEEIRRRMAELRSDLTGDVRAVGRSARVMTDWTFYVRRFPWVMVGLAAIVGYMITPRKKQVISPDQAALADMVRKKQLRLDVDHKHEKPGMLQTLLMMAVTWGAKAGMNYMGERMRIAAANKVKESHHRQPAPSPLHEPLTHTEQPR
jgi:hypothetical protein